MRSEIARKTVIPTFLIFLAVLLIFFGFSYFHINKFIVETYEKSLEEIAINFHNNLADSTEDIKKNGEYIEEFNRIANPVCNDFGIDYVCMYVPYFDDGIIEYSTIVYNDDVEVLESFRKDVINGKIVDTSLTEEERLVWNGEKTTGFIIYNSDFGHELCSVMRETLPDGKNVLVTIERNYNEIHRTATRILTAFLILIIAVYILICVTLYLIISYKVARPAKNVTDAINAFISKENPRKIKLDESRTDEFGVINRSFNKMSDDIENYIRNIYKLNEEKNRQKTEMDIAGEIQLGLLPNPEASFERCNISAMMMPARTVGGDLYDYSRIDDDHILVTVADVSGKGMSAAVFMGATLMLLRQYADVKASPAFILEKTNKYLSQKNPSMLFVTAFIGIYDSKNMTFTYSNAGHNLPYLFGEDMVALDRAKGTVLGLFDDEKYEDATIKMKPGDTLFIYTDGVNEAVNEAGEFYGTDRLEKVLKKYHPSPENNLIKFIRDSVGEFAGKIDQNDDITMLSLTAKTENRLSLDVDTKEFEKIKEAILSSSVPESMKLPLCLASEEIFVNIVSYAFEGKQKDREKIDFHLSVSDCIEVRFEDGGMPYDPRESVVTADEYDLDAQKGGLGKLIAFSIADDVFYENKNNKNILTVVKYKEDSYDNQKGN